MIVIAPWSSSVLSLMDSVTERLIYMLTNATCVKNCPIGKSRWYLPYSRETLFVSIEIYFTTSKWRFFIVSKEITFSVSEFYLFIYIFTENATRRCMEDGTWYFHPEFNNTWTNFSACRLENTGVISNTVPEYIKVCNAK